MDRSVEARSALVWKLMNRALINEKSGRRRPLSVTEANEVADMVLGTGDCPEPGCTFRETPHWGWKHRDGFGHYWWPGETDKAPVAAGGRVDGEEETT